MLSENYSSKHSIYFTRPRLDLIKLLQNNPDQKVLEIGMGGGDTLIEIKRCGLAREVVGIDLMQLPGTNQNDPTIDKTIFLNLDTDNLEYPDNYFDVLIAGDVFEHLIDPWGVLQKLSKKIKKDGQILISLPNFRDFKSIYSILIKGDFKYTDQGIFDKTHLRFFCKNDMIDLVESTPGLKIFKVYTIHELVSEKSFRKIFNLLTFGIFEEFAATQFILDIRKIN